MPRPQEDDDDLNGDSDIVSQEEVSDEPVTINVAEEDGDDDAAERPALTEEQREARRERRRERKSQFEEARQRAEQAERDAQQARADAAAARQQAEQLSNWYRQQQQPQQDPFAAHERALQEEFNFLTEKAALLQQKGEMTDDKLADLRQRTFGVMQRQAGLAAQRQLYYQNAQAQQYQQQNAGNADAQAVIQRLRMDYPDVLGNEKAWQYAWGTYNSALATGKVKANPWDTVQDIMNDTRRVFGMSRAPAPSEATKRRFSGIGGGTNGAARQSGPKTVVMGKHEKGMAKTMYPELYKKDPSLAYKKWARECGTGKDDED